MWKLWRVAPHSQDLISRTTIPVNWRRFSPVVKHISACFLIGLLSDFWKDGGRKRGSVVKGSTRQFSKTDWVHWWTATIDPECRLASCWHSLKFFSKTSWQVWWIIGWVLHNWSVMIESISKVRLFESLLGSLQSPRLHLFSTDAIKDPSLASLLEVCSEISNLYFLFIIPRRCWTGGRLGGCARKSRRHAAQRRGRTG